MKKIEKLTTEQVGLLEKYRNDWFQYGLSTERADRAKAEEGVKLAYAAAKLEAPKYIIWLDSPFQGAIAAAFLKNGKQNQVWDQVWAQVRAQVGAQVRAQVGDQVWDQVWDQVRAQVGDQVGDQVGAQVWAQVWAQVRAQVRAQVWAQVRAAVYGQHEAGWLSFHAFFAEQFGLSEASKGLRMVAQSAGWWWPFENFCILTERPARLCRDEENRLHCENGAALEYPDGWAIHAWHGVRVPPEWITNKVALTPEIALKWENMEQRRAACEILGWANILKQLKAKTIQKDQDPLIGELIEVNLPDIGKERFLRVVCGTGREFALPVPPEMNTALEANAWTYGLSAEQYNPEVRT